MTRHVNQQRITARKLVVLADSFENIESVPARLTAAAAIVTLLRQMLASETAQAQDGPQDDSYAHGFEDGIGACIGLLRAGATPDDLARLLDEDPGQANPQVYQDQLAELRRTLNLGFGDLPTENV
jgi:hypothetical protein